MVGSALKNQLSGDVMFANRRDADLTNFEVTKSLFYEYRPTHVLHLAAIVGGIGGNLMKSGEFFRNNILINTNVLECARLVKVERLISFMSTCIFPENSSYPLSVENIHAGPPHSSNFAYAYAKRMLDIQSRAYRAQWDIDFKVVVPANIYGSHDNWNLEEGHVVPSLIHKCYLAKIKKEPLKVWGSGSPLREFIYSLDVAKLSDWALHNYEGLDPIILTSGIETSIRELVMSVVEAMDFRGEVQFDESKPEGQHRKPSNSLPLKKLLPDFKFTNLQEGIFNTTEWFLKNYPNIRTG